VGAKGNGFGFWINNGTTTTTTLVGFRVFREVKANGVLATTTPATF